ncbi:MAG: aminotransferase class I/II-fold pyridoxal phosphate-dependent enzyme [Spirochaeta sp.]|nr:aminotransferase class I/II-fold pyridoxal phosphate-dependent enzyme [Spirochaeta sp.]
MTGDEMDSTIPQRFFASDNAAPVHARVMEALADCNTGHQLSYGADPVTERCQSMFRELFGKQSETFLVYNGTGANVVSIAAALRSYQAVICSDVAHINTDECGAVEALTGCKLLPVATTDGKVSVDRCAALLPDPNFVHHVQPGLLSLTQSSELGTIYNPDELRSLCDFAHEHGLLVHMDGARIANAAAALGCSLAEVSMECGVDLLSFGGTKNGLMFGEAIVCRNPNALPALAFLRKQTAQLNSKMRYIAAQFEALLQDELWKENAMRANKAAATLTAGLKEFPELRWPVQVQANAVFVQVPLEWIPYLQRHELFYVWQPEQGLIRLMCSYDTEEQDIDRLLSRFREAAGR